MLDVISVNNMRLSDKATIDSGTLGITLMYRAAMGVYNCVSWNGKIGIYCGSGNNAGDGYALALILSNKSYDVDIILCSDKFSFDGKYYYDLCEQKNINIIKYSNTLPVYDIAVDCLLGTGFKGEVNAYYNDVINHINKNKYVVSVDINSGLNGDTGIASLAVKSDITVSIGYLKPGLYLNDAKDYIKKIVNVNIKIKAINNPYKLIEANDLKEFFKPRLNNVNKGSFGYVGIMGGSNDYPGAIRLANMGQIALYSGCGVSRIIVPECIYELIFNNVLESTVYSMPSCNKMMVFDEEMLSNSISKLKALGVGVGWGNSTEYEKILEWILLNSDIKLVIDADGLNTLAKMDLSILNKTKCDVILTPHLKEFSRLIGYSIDDIKNNIIDYSLEFVNKYNTTLLLKGPSTIVCNKDDLYIIPTGCSGMATAGSGDVLTGILVGMLGYSLQSPTYTAALATYLNGYAGEKAMEKYGDYGMVSSDTARMVSLCIKEIEEV